MLEDWFKHMEVPMPLADWRRLPRNAAYKYEFVEGKALIFPEPTCADVVLDLRTFSPPAPDPREEWLLREMTSDDWNSLPEIMARAFSGVAPFATLTNEELPLVSADCLAETRQGKDGSLLPGACMVLAEKNDASSDHSLAGAALVTIRPGETTGGHPTPLLAWIFIDRWTKRRGGAAALLAAVVGALRTLGYTHLESVVCPGNHATVMWHWKMGFTMGPTLHDKVLTRTARRVARF